MASRKRWNNIYDGENPFGLAQTVAKSLQSCTKRKEEEPSKRVRYLWVYLPDRDAYTTSNADERPLSFDELLDIIDEGAGVGARSLIVSTSSPIATHPYLLQICDWAQTTHEMTVGIHLYKLPFKQEDLPVLAKLNKDKTRLFIDGEHMESAPLAEGAGYRVYNADGLDDEIVSPKCEFPGTMTCVSPIGNLYTCGLVLGEQRFKLGHIFERKLTSIMEDSSLPHAIPEGVSKATRRCNGCPPLMAQKMHNDEL